MKYYFPEYDEPRDAMEMKYAYNGHDSDTAEIAAQDFYDASGGDLNDPAFWPKEVMLISPDGETSRWVVSLEYEPVFNAERRG